MTLLNFTKIITCIEKNFNETSKELTFTCKFAQFQFQG